MSPIASAAEAEKVIEDLTALIENFGDRNALRLLDVFVDIGKRPAQLIGEQPAHGRFTRPHEPDQVEARRALKLQ